VSPERWPVELTGTSPAARRLRDEVRNLAQSARTALIVAPAGFDATAIAGIVHVLGNGGGRLLTVECAAPDADIDCVLFGCSVERRNREEFVEVLGESSRLLAARHGTLVLAGVGELPVSTQARLARVLRDGEARVTGTTRPTRLDVRVIATTEHPLDVDVRHGRFRSDLFKRLSVRQIAVAPLRERRDDIGAIATALMDRVARAAGVAPRSFTHAALALIAALSWDGNVTEIESFVRELAAAGTDLPVRVEDVVAQIDPGVMAMSGAPRGNLRDARRQFEREYIAAVLKQSGWHMGQAARVLGIQRTNLYRKARQLGIARGKAGE
jgi:DNA-binding NtrC family response regulator